MKERYPDMLQTRYNIAELGEPVHILEQICENRKFVLRKNELDYERGSKAILDDFRKGRIGRITLEKIEDLK